MIDQTNITMPRTRGLLIALLLPLCLMACAGPQYDDQADAQLTSLQKEVDSQIVQFISDAHQNTAAAMKAGSYAQNIKWYNQVDTDLTSLELRMEASPDPSTAMFPSFFNNLREELSNLQSAHQSSGNLSDITWTATRNQLNAQFAVLLTYELSLKGSSSPSTTSAATTTKGSKN